MGIIDAAMRDVDLTPTSNGTEIVIFGEGPKILSLPGFFGDVVHIGSIRVPMLELITIGTGIVVVVLFYALLQRTTFGATIPAFERNASSTIARTASGASATSS